MLKRKVLVGMSGGVDSSVTAALLKEQGYEVYGATMQIWQDANEEFQQREGGCCSISAVDDARRVCDKLDIPYYVLNFKDIFKEKVIDYFVDEYKQGRTPNPCIACNKELKFESLLQKALSLGIDYVSTGHYSKIEYNEELGRYLLLKSVTDKKDQTYALYNLTQEQLKHTLMPLGNYEKDKVREMATKYGFTRVANKPDSQEICFVEDNNYARFIKDYSGYVSNPGIFKNLAGECLGKHNGIINYTIGQRKGLGVTFGKPMFVVSIDSKTDTVYLGESHEVFSNELIADNLNLISIDKIDKPIRVKAKIRYSAKESASTVESISKTEVRVKFDEPQRAITKGQAVVFYDGEIVVGGGTIK